MARVARRFGLAAATLAAAIALSQPASADKALLIGIDAYADGGIGAPPGASAAADVAAIRGLLTQSLGYAPGDLQVLADQAADRAAILAAFDEWLVRGTEAGERVFFYFSGLGYFQADTDGDEADGLDEAIVPFDATAGADGAISGLILDDEINGLLDRLAGRTVTVAIDAGFSGVVTGAGAAIADADALRAPRPGGRTRAILIEPAAQAQKSEGAAFDTDRLTGNIAVYTAASGGQAALVEGGVGVFTAALVAAIEGQAADINGNGVVSHAEVLNYIRDQSAEGCSRVSACALGLTPTLGPAAALGAAIAGPAAAPSPAPGPAGPAPPPAALTADQVLDYFGKGNTVGVTLQQYPPSPVPLGALGIRFTVTSPVGGTLVLLDLNDNGELVQLFPNQFVSGDPRLGQILPGSPITVPDAFYGIRFDATSPSSGTLIAVVTNGPVEMPATVRTRAIQIIPVEEAKQDYLPAIAEALVEPAVTQNPGVATQAADWSVATLRYEIK